LAVVDFSHLGGRVVVFEKRNAGQDKVSFGPRPVEDRAGYAASGARFATKASMADVVSSEASRLIR
jgi:hypothetical protein